MKTLLEMQLMTSVQLMGKSPIFLSRMICIYLLRISMKKAGLGPKTAIYSRMMYSLNAMLPDPYPISMEYLAEFYKRGRSQSSRITVQDRQQ